MVGVDEVSLMDSYAAEISVQPDVRVETNELHNVLLAAIVELPVFEQKFVKLHGIDF